MHIVPEIGLVIPSEAVESVQENKMIDSRQHEVE